MDINTPQPAPAGRSNGILWIVVIIIIVLAAAGGYVWFKSAHGGSAGAGSGEATTIPVTNFNPASTDASSTAAATLPTGFPTDIPVEAGRLTESYIAHYPHLTAYNVSYTSSSSQAALIKTYTDFFARAGYAADASNTDMTIGKLRANAKNGDELDVLVARVDTGAVVKINYLARE